MSRTNKDAVREEETGVSPSSPNPRNMVYDASEFVPDQ
jgi:hypothetical protein